METTSAMSSAWTSGRLAGENLDALIEWDKFKENQYVVLPTAEDWEEDPVGLRPFYDDPEKNPLPTPSGKLEFYSERIAKYYPDDTERHGRVSVAGEVWGALSKHDQTLPLGSKVRITEMQGTRVVVEPLDTASQNQETP